MKIYSHLFVRKFFYILGSVILFLTLAPGCNAQEMGKPNIIVILADDMGYSDIGSFGSEIHTPNLDKLAENGLSFTQFYNNPRCSPSRASLLTGLYSHQAGIGNMVYKNNGPGYLGYLNENTVTLAEVLKDAGYTTVMTGKWHVGHKKGQWPTDRGFERFYGIHKHIDAYYKVLKGSEVYLDNSLLLSSTEPPVNHLNPEQEWYSTDAFTDYAIQFLKEEQDNKNPFFLYLAYNAPHFPLEAPLEDIKKYVGIYMEGWDARREKKLKRMKEMGIISAGTELSPSENAAWDTISMEDRKELDFRRAIYAAQIDRMDQNIGRLLDYLEEKGELDNTLIIFVSDNGSSAETGTEENMFGQNWPEFQIDNFDEWSKLGGWSTSQGRAWANLSNTPFRLYKRWTHEGGISTPLIAHWPKVIKQKGELTDQVGHLIDVMATVCDITGANYPRFYNGNSIKPLEGKSLLPVFQGKQREGHEVIYWEHLGNKAARMGKWKLVLRHDRNKWELYDMNVDRSEINDISEDHPEIVQELIKGYHAWAERSNVRPWPLTD
jgi:arylsulfatase A-like enzyme